MKNKRRMLPLLLAAMMVCVLAPTTTALAAPGSDFVVTGGELGTDYAYTAEGTVGLLTIKTNRPMTISMALADSTTITDTIAVEANVSANITLDNVRITVGHTPECCAFLIPDGSTGDVNITLVGDNVLSSGSARAGLEKNGSGAGIGTLTIGGTGILTVTGGGDAAGIGGNGGDGSCITILSGTVTASTGGFGAGIGGGNGGDGSHITISGGTVEATGWSGGAGIGGGSGGSGSNITISGDAEVTVLGGAGGAGIGGGNGDSGSSNITISGGTVEATSVSQGAGIGGGSGGDGSGITISGGTVEATSGSQGAGIGGGDGGDGSHITISGGTVTAICSNAGAGIGGGWKGVGIDITISGGTVTAAGASGAGLGGGYEGGGSNIRIAPAAGKALSVSVGAAAPGAPLTGSPFDSETAYTGTDWYFHSERGVLTAALTSATADGASGTTTSTKIDLVFSKAVIGLTADNITITNGTGSAVKGVLTGSGTAWSVALTSVAAEGTVSVAVSAPDAYTVITGSPKTATVRKLAVTGIPSTFSMFTGGRATWDPQPEGGTWNWDEEFFSATFSSPATFTALKAGTSAITYTVGGVTHSVTVTIRVSGLPSTGQDNTLLWALGALAALCGGAAAALTLRRVRRKACS